LTEKRRRPLIASYMILEAWLNYEYFGLMAYGPLRCGKSSYGIQVLAEVCGIIKNPEWKKAMRLPLPQWQDWVLENTEPEWDAWKTWLLFTPREFVNKIKETSREQRCMLVWDDAGFWLSQYGWNDPFVQSVAEYLNVLATDWACVLFTTPDPRWILTHVRRLPGGHTGRVTKITGAEGGQFLRYMTVYEGWVLPDLAKHRVRRVFQDHFSVKLPSEVFWEYDEYRRRYTAIAKKRMEEFLALAEKHWGPVFAEKKRGEITVETGIEL